MDTPEGWQPKDQQKQLVIYNDKGKRGNGEEEEGSSLLEQQHVHDYMDEQDHNEWGGPTRVRQDLQGRRDTPLTSGPALTESIFSVKAELVPSDYVGSRLLQKMGWRKGSSAACVPTDHSSETKRNNNNNKTADDDVDTKTTLYLSQRRLRKIQVQQERIKIPRPKLDQVGLGFEAHANAPEFRAFAEKRRQMAQQRARGNHRAVYRLSSLLEEESQIGGKTEKSTIPRIHHHQQQHDSDADQNYESYEVVEDFVGKRTVGGFALHDDEDDAYDDNVGHHHNPTQYTKVSDRLVLDKEQYNTVIEDAHSDDDDGENNKVHRDAKFSGDHDLASGLLAWTDATVNTDKGPQTGNDAAAAFSTTSDGRVPPAGFVLGSSRSGILKRYRGPDIPEDYEVTLHIFREEEHPLVWQTLARAVELENDQARREAAIKDALSLNRIHQKKSHSLASTTSNKSATPLAGLVFSSLASSMKNRFTAGQSDEADRGDKIALPAGLVSASALPKSSQSTSQSEEATTRRSLAVTRSVQSFVPVPLLCKRFGVRAPTLNSQALVPQSGSDQPTSREESYFRDEILTVARQRETPPSLVAKEMEEDKTPGINPFENRPSDKTYRSIFGVQDSESEDENKSTNDQENSTQEEKLAREGRDESIDEMQVVDKFVSEISEEPQQAKRHKEENTWTSDSSLESDASRGRASSIERKKRKKKDRKKKKHRKREKRYYDSDDSEEHRHKKRKRDRRDDKKKSYKSKRRKDQESSLDAK